MSCARQSLMVNTDILIVGGGVMGSSIAYHLARQGRDVLVVERAEVATEPAASWASAGGVRRQGRHPAEAALACEAAARARRAATFTRGQSSSPQARGATRWRRPSACACPLKCVRCK